MPCPKCKSNNIILGEKYQIKRTPIKMQRLVCKDCGHSFIRRTKRYKIKIPLKVRGKIIRLSKTNKHYRNKFDHLKKKTYSTREIAKMMDVSKSYVWAVIKRGG